MLWMLIVLNDTAPFGNVFGLNSGSQVLQYYVGEALTINPGSSKFQSFEFKDALMYEYEVSIKSSPKDQTCMIQNHFAILIHKTHIHCG